jgi:hypothetical protein
LPLLNKKRRHKFLKWPVLVLLDEGPMASAVFLFWSRGGNARWIRRREILRER